MHSRSVMPGNGVLTLSGYALRVAVERGHLVVEEGVAENRRRGRFSRVTKDLKRVVVIGHSGTVSLDALRWLHDVGAAFVQIDNDGRVITAAGPIGLNDARLRRAQALAVANGTGMAIACDLVQAKLEAQAALVEPLPGGSEAAAEIRQYADETGKVDSIDGLRMIEGHAANRYWTVWREVPIQFISRDRKRIPDHWQTFGSRSSLLTKSPRRATNPANAMLNYLYAILEAEARLAILAVGCDPGIGVIHADQEARDSFACDLMEVIRPKVDGLLLDALTTRTFRKADFFESRDGVCRVMPPLTYHLTEAAPSLRNALAPIVEDVAQRFIEAAPFNPSPGSMQGMRQQRKWAPNVPKLPTCLTERSRSTGRSQVRTKAKRNTAPAKLKIPKTCVDCGKPIKKGQQCIVCHRPDRPELMAKARSKAQAMRASGEITPKKLGEKQAKHRRKIPNGTEPRALRTPNTTKTTSTPNSSQYR